MDICSCLSEPFFCSLYLQNSFLSNTIVVLVTSQTFFGLCLSYELAKNTPLFEILFMGYGENPDCPLRLSSFCMKEVLSITLHKQCSSSFKYLCNYLHQMYHSYITHGTYITYNLVTSVNL